MDLRTLVDGLDPTARRALEAAAGGAMAKTHYEIEIEHWLHALLDRPDTGLRGALPKVGLSPEALERALDRGLARCRTGSSRAPAFSPRVVSLMREAWFLATLRFKAGAVSPLHLLAALVADDKGALAFGDLAAALEAIDPPALDALIEAEMPAAGAPGAAPASAAKPGGRTPNLDAYTIDLTAEAAQGRIDPITGRDAEVRQVIDILTRRRQNNPILVGEAGVGKTAVVESLALRIAAGEVPAALREVSIRTLDLGLLQAGAGVKGEFENRLKGVIDEVKGSIKPIILFVDEAHTLIGAGGQAGQGDAANLLKPDLARGALRMVAATTWAEYKRYIERDAALVRRFQPVKVDEPDENTAIAMMRGLVPTLEKHHGVRILDAAVRAAVHLSHRYITGRQLPDKCVSVLDTAAAMVAMSQAGRPEALDAVARETEGLEAEKVSLLREVALGADHGDAIATLDERLADAQRRQAALHQRWTEERRLVDEIIGVRGALETKIAQSAQDDAPASDTDVAALRGRHARLHQDLTDHQGEQPLMHHDVTAQAVAEVVARWTGIPVGRMLSSEIETVLGLEGRLGQRVVGQDDALHLIADVLHTARAGIADPRKPPAIFLLAGPSGVGKTETALALADMMYGGEQSLTVINMSEFKEEHKVSLLMGSPPGYVGYGEGGILTEAVRRRPYGVLLLDEMEKAHPGVQDIFYQVFDKGVLRDGEGRDIDFRNTTILMASNAGSDLLTALAADRETLPDLAGLSAALHPELLKHYKAAFLGRVTVVPYLPLTAERLRDIVGLQLGRLRQRVEQTYGATLTVSPAVVERLVARCGESDVGARAIDHVLSRSLMPALSKRLLETLAARRTVAAATVDWDDEAGDFRIDIQTVPLAERPMVESAAE
ncbi:type VI secretion system ATPase TssH [Nitrospirillum pindoramense]|uniref:Type VI secretion system protein VasG n=1 Tax=Nitrospirillum amazonense TaxID=28077 RepID=A0A560H465_9PROT|nr:type VI secretion system ATPase TssH [Nitrospirillum amazonense]TWB41092.1 type VI secretion system protein VasG [Nitrospirillum amazonense]